MDTHGTGTWTATLTTLNEGDMEAEEQLERLRASAAARKKRWREKKRAQGLRAGWVQVVSGAPADPQWKPLTPESLRELVAAAPIRRGVRPKPVTRLDEWGESFRDHFWPDYLKLGRPCSVALALKAWQSVPHGAGQEDFDELWESYGAAKVEWAKRSDPAFIPHAATWLSRFAKDKQLRLGGVA